MLKKVFTILCMFLFGGITVHAQEIDFGQFGNFSLSIGELTTSDLDFGTVVSGDGLISVPLSNAKVITLTGVRYLDVIVSINADAELLLDGNLSCQGDPSCSIPYTMEAAYANLGENNISHAKFFNVSSNSTSAQFPILRRSSGPPSPPPTPQHKGFDPSLFEETAYVYIYGSINVGNVNAGSYVGNITVSVVYD